jgi:hypothetical protein
LAVLTNKRRRRRKTASKEIGADVVPGHMRRGIEVGEIEVILEIRMVGFIVDKISMILQLILLLRAQRFGVETFRDIGRNQDIIILHVCHGRKEASH